MTGAAITIDDSAATDTIRSVKQRVFAANRELPVRRQRLVYRPGPHGMEALADDETLGGAGVARDGTAELDVLVESMTADEMAALNQKVMLRLISLTYVSYQPPMVYARFLFFTFTNMYVSTHADVCSRKRRLCARFVRALGRGCEH